MKSRILIIFVVLVAASFAGGFALLRARASQQNQPLPAIKPAVVRVARLERRPYTMNESFYGLIRPNMTIDMSFQISGKLQQLGPEKGSKLKENTPVHKNDVVAMIEPERFEGDLKVAMAQAEEAKAGITSGKAAINSAAAEVAKAQAAVNQSKQKIQLQQTAAQQGAAVSPIEVANMEAEYRVAAAELDKANANKNAAEAQTAAAEAKYESAVEAQRRLNAQVQDCILRVPFDGVVARVPFEVGQMVVPGQSVMTLIDMSKTKLVLGVVEAKLPLLKQGQKVRVDVLALSNQARISSEAADLAKPRDGVITLVPPSADPQTGVFNVEVELDNADGRLRPGMVAKASVVLLEKQAVAIPADAVERSGNHIAAFFVQEGANVGLDLGAIGRASAHVPTATVKRVTLDPLTFDKDYYLLNEVPEGATRIVIEGQSRLTDGQPVIIVD